MVRWPLTCCRTLGVVKTRRGFLVPFREEGVAINTGLSVRMCGVLLVVERDEAGMTARVTVSPDGNGWQALSADERRAVMHAALLLKERAERFLGRGWRVEGLKVTGGVNGHGR